MSFFPILKSLGAVELVPRRYSVAELGDFDLRGPTTRVKEILDWPQQLLDIGILPPNFRKVLGAMGLSVRASSEVYKKLEVECSRDASIITKEYNRLRKLQSGPTTSRTHCHNDDEVSPVLGNADDNNGPMHETDYNEWSITKDMMDAIFGSSDSSSEDDGG